MTNLQREAVQKMFSFYRLKMAIVFTCVVVLAFILTGAFSGNRQLLSSFTDSWVFTFCVTFVCWLIAPFFYKFFEEK